LRPEAIHQFIPTLAPRDAIGAHTLQVRALLRDMGFGSEIFAGEAQSEMASEAHPYRQFGGERHRGRHQHRSWLLYQSSIGSPVGDFVAGCPEPKLVNFHNVTPSAYLEAWDPEVAQATALGHQQLVELAPDVMLAIAVSRFNRGELTEAGFRSTAVAPLLIDLGSGRGDGDGDADAATVERLMAARRTGGADLLFVGRIAPHKAQHDLIKALAAYRQAYDPKARLHLVGGVSSPAYRRALDRFVADLGLAEAVDMPGSVTDDQLAAYYRSADVFVCCSDHEGFCVPLLEAMHHELAIVAFGAAAVPETVGVAGVVLPAKGPALVAAAVHRVVDDTALRAVLLDAGRARLAELSLERSRARFAAIVEETVGDGTSLEGVSVPS
jgi:glycosyltransferase involved in cell wall biosynthesis